MFSLPSPAQQVEFSFRLGQIRTLYLQEALSATIKKMDIAAIDAELGKYVPNTAHAAVAQKGLRGELLFPMPCVLRTNPMLLGYYRLLLGYSKKEFYTAVTGASKFALMEEKGRLTPGAEPLLDDLCKALVAAACELVEGIGADRLTRGLLDDLTLLTLGPQLRGGANVRVGADATVTVFEVIHDIVKDAATSSNPTCIIVRNAAGRDVFIEFAPDPDIIIREEMAGKTVRYLVAIEIKGGKDFSNIHNRLGEAEKSHQKAKGTGYTECWTVVNVDRFDFKAAKKESPTTNRFYKLSELTCREGSAYEAFRNQIISLTGIPSN